MTLNDFIARAVAFFDKAEPTLTAPKADGRVAELEGKLSEATKTIEARDATIKDLSAKLETAQNDVNAKGAELKAVQAKLEAETKRVDETLAAQGVPPGKIPAGKPDEASGGGDILAKLEKITDPVARTEFWNKNKAAIYAARRNLK